MKNKSANVIGKPEKTMTTRIGTRRRKVIEDSASNVSISKNLLPDSSKSEKPNALPFIEFNKLVSVVTNSPGPSTSNDVPKSKDGDSTNISDFQVKLKEQIDLLYRKINAQDCCLKLVDRFIKKSLTKSNNRIFLDFPDNNQRKSLETFCKNYRFLRKRCRKLTIQISRVDLYETLYDNEKRKKTTTTTINNDNREKKIFLLIKPQNKISNEFHTINVSQSTNLDPIKPAEIEPDNIVEEQQQLGPMNCDQCGRTFKNQYRLKIHVAHKHERKERFECTFQGCTANYGHRETLVRHIQTVHTKEAKVYHCEFTDCTYKTYSVSDLRRHRVVYHDVYESSNNPVTIEPQISKQPKPKKPRKRKDRSPKATTPSLDLSNTDPVTCDQCGKVFKNQARLKVHVTYNHERTERFRCTVDGCKANYAFSSELHRHVRIIHTKKARQFPCTWDGCSYVTYANHMLQKHLNVHTGNRPYKCIWPGCDKAFKSNSSLALHSSIHKPDRRYKCQWPGCTFESNFSIRRHMAMHQRKQKRAENNDNGLDNESDAETIVATESIVEQ